MVPRPAAEEEEPSPRSAKGQVGSSDKAAEKGSEKGAEKGSDKDNAGEKGGH